MKKFTAFLILILVIIGSVFCIGAFAENVSITMQIDNETMDINGTKTAIDDIGTTPVIADGRTLVPIRAIIEAMGGTAEWQADIRTTVLSYNGSEIRLVIDSKTAYVNDESAELDTAPVIINGRTMLPIRFIAEGFGFNVFWDNDTKTITITGSSAEETETVTAVTSEETTEITTQGEDTTADGGKVLVVYFSNTGNTERVAQKIAEKTGGDIYRLQPKDPYTEDDLNYNIDGSRANTEQNDPTARPEIEGTIENMEDYDTVYVGYPIWWGQAPKIMYTFMESYDFSGKTIIPFCTSGSSPIGDSAENMHSCAPDAVWLAGARFSSSPSESDIADLING